MLKRKECSEILMKHKLILGPKDVTDEQRIEALLGLLDDDYFYIDFGHEIVAALNEIPNAQHKCIASLSKKVNSITFYLSPNVVKTVLELGPVNFEQEFITYSLAHYRKVTRRILQLPIGSTIETQDTKDTVGAFCNSEGTSLLY